VTVLFGDLVGFTGLSETLDPEQVKHLVDDRFERLVDVIERFGGRVDKIIGDAIVALFGAPVAHEDDAERAVRAALRMQETMAEAADVAGGRVEMRIGVNTGEVLVGALRSGGDYTAMGDVVNTASRLQTNAAPGQVLVGPDTHRSTRDVVSYEACDPITVRGRIEPVPCWIALDPIAPPGHRPNRPAVPLVGRSHELSLLTGAVATSASRSRASLMLVSGEAGVGKSRLSSEVASWASSHVDALVLEGRCVPYGEANVWWPIAEALRSGIGIEPDDDLDAVVVATTASVAQTLDLSPEEPEVLRTVAGLLYLMGHDTLGGIDVARDHDEVVRALVTFAGESSRSRPVLVVLSDLHWADEAVLSLLDTLLERLDHERFAVLATARASLTERWTPTSGHHSLVVLHLDPLSEAASARLIEELSGEVLDEALAQALLERSGGNPFFLEELVALVGEVEGSDELPGSLRALVLARLDGLSPVERAVVEDAAVLGRRGEIDALQTMVSITRGLPDVSAEIDALIHREMLSRDGRHWEFRSELVREVAYSTLTKADRAERHAGIAKWCRSNLDERHDSVVERIAHNYARAAELASDFSALGGVPDDIDALARTWLVKAADRADAADLGREAARLYTEALALRPANDEERRSLQLGRARGLMKHSDHSTARVEISDVVDEACEVGDDAHLLEGLTLLGDCELRLGMAEIAAERFDRALAMATDMGADAQRAEILRLRGMMHVFSGDDQAASVELTAALDLFESLGDQRGVAWVLQHLSWSAFMSGRVVEAERHLRRAIDTFTDRGDRGGLGWALGLYAWVKFHLGDGDGAEWLAMQVLDSGLERGDRWGAGMMEVLLSSIRLWSGRTDEAIAAAQRAFDIFEELDDAFGGAQARGILGRALTTGGRIVEAREVFDRTRADSDRPGELEPAWQIPELLSAVQIGDLAWTEAASARVESGDISPERVGGTDQLVALTLAALQRRDADRATALLDEATTEESAGNGSVIAAEALVGAAQGDRRRTDRAVARLADCTSVTYLDRTMARLAEAVAVSGVDGRAILADGLDELSTTGDRVGPLVLGLADAALAEATGADDRLTARRRSEGIAHDLGIGADGWRAYIDLVVGTADAAIPTT